jgi:hypothetical protein
MAFPTNRYGLVGEQSNAHRILLRYDRKSRHRRIKKQRRYERLAATSQFRDTSNHDLIARSFLNLCRPVDDRTLSGGRSPYLRCIQECTHTLASVEPLSYNQKVGEPSRLRIISILQVFTDPFSGLYLEALPSRFGTKDLSRLPRIQVCCQFHS